MFAVQVMAPAYHQQWIMACMDGSVDGGLCGSWLWWTVAPVAMQPPATQDQMDNQINNDGNR
eukprot:1161565-Pelagomonas_calceolata.AAC.3